MTILSISDIRYAADRLLIFLAGIKPEGEVPTSFEEAHREATEATERLNDNSEDLHDHLKAALMWTQQYVAHDTKRDTF